MCQLIFGNGDGPTWPFLSVGWQIGAHDRVVCIRLVVADRKTRIDQEVSAVARTRAYISRGPKWTSMRKTVRYREMLARYMARDCWGKIHPLFPFSPGSLSIAARTSLSRFGWTWRFFRAASRSSDLQSIDADSQIAKAEIHEKRRLDQRNVTLIPSFLFLPSALIRVNSMILSLCLSLSRIALPEESRTYLSYRIDLSLR